MTQQKWTLSLEWLPLPERPSVKALDIKVNGVPFIELVSKWERAHVPENEQDIAETYAGFFEYYSPLLEYWLAPEKTPEGIQAKAAVLGCSCGEVGCWPLEADVTITEYTVTWSNFLQPHRENTWSYKGFGPFVFERQPYEKAVRHAFVTAPD